MTLFRTSGLATLLPALLLVCPVSQVLADVVYPNQADGLYETYNAGAYGKKPNQTYHSSNLKSPLFFVNVFEKDRVYDAPHILLSPTVAGQERSPIVFNSHDLSLVYADPELNGANPQLQELDGEQYFTYWTGKDMKGWGTGGGTIMNGNFEVIYNLTAVDLGTGADNHEFQLTHDGGAMLNNYHPVVTDLTSINGPPDGLLQDCAFQEVDLETNDVRFTWRATDHFDLPETMGADYYDHKNGYDWFHMNSLFKTRDGNYLISVRHLRTVALINGTDGSRIWQVGGKRNSFRDLSDGQATNFGYQHHARFIDPTFTLEDSKVEITLFDNHVMFESAPTPGCDHDCSRGLHIELDLDAMTARVVREYYHPRSVQAWAQGGYHALPNGHALIGWGTVPMFTEFDNDGNIVMDVQIGPWDSDVTSYRVYKSTWVAQPPWNPAVALVDGSLYVSWNGATEVVTWSLVSFPPKTGANPSVNF